MEKGKNVAVYCGSRYGINPAHTAFAGMAGELLAKNGYTMIYGGGSVGLMGIAADAALAAGGKVVGIIPEVFIAAEQAHRLITELIEVPDLMARKRKMIEAGDAFLILPGGFVHRNFQTFPLILFSFCTSFCSKDLPFILYACLFLLLFIFSQTIPCKNG